MGEELRALRRSLVSRGWRLDPEGPMSHVEVVWLQISWEVDG